jgi:hypothetical protein
MLPLGLEYPPLAMASYNWPWPYKTDSNAGREIEGHDDLSAGKIIERKLLPASYFARLLSDSFWQDGKISRKSDSYFHLSPTIFVSRTPNDPSRYLSTYQTDVGIDDQLDQTGLGKADRFMIQEWQAREAGE